ncbi:discoidin domain-containing protein [Streptomyces sp. ODS05-4]|uniref:discoidin domain-containing protein n=1 Tax=Streptomyces sp. ODS05-4 TaxID=2944939 RepID=UPI00210C55FD|nr:discoidin domain-containing protein [Streptomyces sp. ODS05-4]
MRIRAASAALAVAAAGATLAPARGAEPTCSAQPPVAATASTSEPANPPARAIDGDLASRWSGQGFGAQLTLDLGAIRELCGARIAWHQGDRRWNDFTLYVSDTPTFATYKKVWEGRSPGDTAGLTDHSFAGVRGRYLRVSFWQNPVNDWASISEVLPKVTGAQPAKAPVIVAAGDIANACTGASCPASRTALRAQALNPDAVLTLGDHANGPYGEFTRYYDPTWGKLKGLTRPTVGNHEYDEAGAAGYFRYFGSAAGTPERSWYSFDLGSWHIVSLNSEVDRKADGRQVAWLRQDLAAMDKKCVLSYWHRPKYSSGTGHGDFPNMKPFWDELQTARADVILNGHDHDYERFAPQSSTGVAGSGGIRQFVVGTGGSDLRDMGPARPHSEVRVAHEYGVLKMTLDDGSYSWQFLGDDGAVLDSGGPVACK